MSFKTLSMTVAAAALLASGAIAQTTTPPSTGGTAPADTPSATTPAPGAPGAGSMGGTGGAGGAAGTSTGAATSTTTTTKTTSVNFLPSQGPNEMRASNLRGMAVRNAANENLGDINDIVMDQGGSPKAVIIGVGGFLGLGEKNVGVPFNALTFTQANDGTRVARLDVTKEALQSAPTYAYADNKATGTTPAADRSAPRTQ